MRLLLFLPQFSKASMDSKCDLIAGMNQTVGLGTLQVDYWVHVTGLLLLTGARSLALCLNRLRLTSVFPAVELRGTFKKQMPAHWEVTNSGRCQTYTRSCAHTWLWLIFPGWNWELVVQAFLSHTIFLVVSVFDFLPTKQKVRNIHVARRQCSL